MTTGLARVPRVLDDALSLPPVCARFGVHLAVDYVPRLSFAPSGATRGR